MNDITKPSSDSAIVEPFEPDRLYRNTHAALDIIAARATRDRWRSQGQGPAFVRLGEGKGAPIGYWGKALNQWVAERCFTSTAAADQAPSAKRWRTRRQKRLEAGSLAGEAPDVR